MHSLIITLSSACFLCYIFGLASALASTSSQLASASRPKITTSASALCTYGLVNIPEHNTTKIVQYVRQTFVVRPYQQPAV